MLEPHSISLYPGSGTVDGKRGDHVIVSPAYTVTDEDVALMADRVAGTIEDFFISEEFAQATGASRRF